jgi:hypothetical protein
VPFTLHRNPTGSQNGTKAGQDSDSRYINQCVKRKGEREKGRKEGRKEGRKKAAG